MAGGLKPNISQAPPALNLSMYETGPDTTLLLWPDFPLNPDGSPTLDLYFTKKPKPNSKVLVICPGGGYRKRAIHEGQEVAHFFNRLGYHTAVIQYRVGPNAFPKAYADGRKAFELLRQTHFLGVSDPSWVLMGFSAGGHLASSLATLPNFKLNNPYHSLVPMPHLEALVLAYPVISMTHHFHKGSREQLLGLEPDSQLLNLLSIENQVKATLCKTYIFHTEDDASVSIENAKAFASACKKYQVPCQTDFRPHGKHGVGLAQEYANLKSWPIDMLTWLEQK